MQCPAKAGHFHLQSRSYTDWFFHTLNFIPMFESRDTAIDSSVSYPRLLADIGGTNARFGWQSHEGGGINHVHVLACAEFESLLVAAQTYLQLYNLPTPRCASFGIATPIIGDQVAMTNHHWQFSIHALRQGLKLTRLLLLNDFTALALALTNLTNDDKRQIGGGEVNPNAAIGLIGPGTGLGVSGLLPIGYQNKWIPITGEGGHVSLGASNKLEFALIEQLQKRYGHVSAERVLCGAGLVSLPSHSRQRLMCLIVRIKSPPL
jgi:glucokinase